MISFVLEGVNVASTSGLLLLLSWVPMHLLRFPCATCKGFILAMMNSETTLSVPNANYQ